MTSKIFRCDVQYSTVQYSTVQCSKVQYSTAQHSTVQYSTVQYSKVEYSTLHITTAQSITVQLCVSLTQYFLQPFDLFISGYSAELSQELFSILKLLRVHKV